MIEFDDLDDIFGRNDASDRSHDEDEDEDGYAKSRSKHRDDEAEEDNGDQDENGTRVTQHPFTGRLMSEPGIVALLQCPSVYF